jgi:hypothetical protein
MAAAFGVFASLAVAGCGGSEGGSGDFTQKFEPPKAAEGGQTPPPATQEKPKSRREMIDEDQSAAQQKKGKGR